MSGAAFLLALGTTALTHAQIGREVSIPRHLPEGDEFSMSLEALLEQGRRLFAANWAIQEGGGRPLTKGTGAALRWAPFD